MNKRKLKLVDANEADVVKDITCFSAQLKYNTCCQRKSCKEWINSDNNNNCSIIAAGEGPKTLQDIGKIFDLTRMRICQIEKGINKKIRDLI